MNVTLGLAFLAGLVSFLSPCVFSLIPGYLSYISGRTMAAFPRLDGKTRQWLSIDHGLAFFIGFTFFFIITRAPIFGLASLSYQIRDWLSKIGGFYLVIFGFQLLGLLHIPFLSRDLSPLSLMDRVQGYISSILIGISFSAGWTPCVGPVLGAILTSVMMNNLNINNTGLLVCYSIGIGLPFLLMALIISWTIIIICKSIRVALVLKIILGIMQVIMGVMLFLGSFESLERFGFFFTFGI